MCVPARIGPAAGPCGPSGVAVGGWSPNTAMVRTSTEHSHNRIIGE